MNPENAEKNVNFCLNQAYKIAVRNLGILDWSTTSDERKRQCEEDQLFIARMILDAQLGRVHLD